MDEKNIHVKDLIIRAKNGDQQAFEEVYTTYYSPIYHYLFSRVKNKGEAEDLAQTVFLKIWSALDRFSEEHTSPIAYFFTVARNTLIDYYRKNKNREIVSDEIVTEISEKNGVWDKELIDENQYLAIKKALGLISKEQQEIINLIYENDLSYREISQILNKKEDAVRQMHSRALKKLREIYKE